jgi:hypothetical protein
LVKLFTTFHFTLIKWLASTTHKKDGYLNLYFHPWEFTDLNQNNKFGLPRYIFNNSGIPYVASNIESLFVGRKEEVIRSQGLAILLN